MKIRIWLEQNVKLQILCIAWHLHVSGTPPLCLYSIFIVLDGNERSTFYKEERVRCCNHLLMKGRLIEKNIYYFEFSTFTRLTLIRVRESYSCFNHRNMEWFKLGSSSHLVPNPLPWAETSSTRSVCSKPHPTCP